MKGAARRGGLRRQCSDDCFAGRASTPQAGWQCLRSTAAEQAVGISNFTPSLFLKHPRVSYSAIRTDRDTFGHQNSLCDHGGRANW